MILQSLPRLRPGEIHLKWHVHSSFQGSTIYNSQDMEIHQNVQWQKNEDHVEAAINWNTTSQKTKKK